MDSIPNIEIHENVFSDPADIFEKLEKNIQYLSSVDCSVYINGNAYPVPRQLVAYGDTGLTYTFTGLTVSCKPWTPLLLEIKSVVERLSGCSYNFVVLNRYKDGQSCIGQHKDNEHLLCDSSPICSLSFGEKRTMIFQRPGFSDHSIELLHNSLVVMKPPTNQRWTHGIPRQPEREGVRVSLTFRNIQTSNKRKNYDFFDVKRTRKEPEGSAVLKDGEFPENVYHIGQDLFIVVNLFQDIVYVNVRRFKKYGLKYYPTKEGVVMKPYCFSFTFAKPPPTCKYSLESTRLFDEDGIKLESSDFVNFCFTKVYSSKPSVSITINSEEWVAISNVLENITTVIVDLMYKYIDFHKEFNLIADNDILDVPSLISDTYHGMEAVAEILRDVICDLVKQSGVVKTPYLYDDNVPLSTNSVTLFNRQLMQMNVKHIVHVFRDRLCDPYPNLILKPINYLTKDFLQAVCLKNVIDDARSILCPPCSDPEIYRDIEDSQYF